jgi:hypothetical protein
LIIIICFTANFTLTWISCISMIIGVSPSVY